MRVWGMILVAGLVLAGSSYAQADLIYTFGFNKPIFNGLPGAKVSVDLILTETATNGEALRFSGPSGLTGFGPMTIDYAPTAGSAAGVSIADAAAVSINNAYPDTEFNRFISIDNVAHTLELYGVTDTIGIQAPANVSTFTAVLATIEFTVDGALNEEALIKVNRHPLGNAFFNGDFDSADTNANATYGSSSFLVSAVPEPSSAICLALVASAGLFRRRRQ